MGNFKPFYGNSVKFYENKKAKAIKNIEKKEAEIKVEKEVIVECDKAIAEIKNNENK